MTYAFFLLAVLAVITWSLWAGIPLPSLQAGSFDTADIRERLTEFAQNANERIRASIRGAVRDQLHEAVDEALPEGG